MLSNQTVDSLISPDENGRSSPPTRKDIQETINLLDDFGIYTDIPEFKSKVQLYLWRKAEIMNRLS